MKSALAGGLCDDAAVFPPGSMSLPAAVAAHLEHERAWYATFVGPMIVSDTLLRTAMALVPAGRALAVSVTLPEGPSGLRNVLAAADDPSIGIEAVEVALPRESSAEAVVAEIVGTLGRTPNATTAYVELPRDTRRDNTVCAVADAGLRAKFRTGGVRADLYPKEAELAAGLAAVIEARLPFKATAGLHHAVRNTDPVTGFEQHGFLNIMLATDVLLQGGSEQEARTALAERDATVVSRQLRSLEPERVGAARSLFVSFGTCSISDPLAELLTLGLIVAPSSGDGVS